MNKTMLVAKREFLARVRKKTFLLTTILLPLIIFLFYGMMIFFSVSDDDSINVAVADNANLLNGKLETHKDIHFSFVNNETEATLNKKLENKQYDAYVFIPNGTTIDNFDTLHLVANKKISLGTRESIESAVAKQVSDKRLLALNIPRDKLDSVQGKKSHLDFSTLKGGKEDEIKTGISYGVGFLSGFLIYLVLFIYGTMVMRGVMEEKVSRIAEVIVSSLKPFQLMMGKIIGIGAVGLVQFLIWVVLITALQMLLPLIFPGLHPGNMPSAGNAAAAQDAFSKLQANLAEINFPLIIGCFVFYFIGGYLLYSSLFAAVGSAVNEDPQDAQSLLLPITMPIVFGMVIMMKAVNNPYSNLAVFGSLFPLTSPIVMMARIAHGVPDGVSVWELVLSMAFLVGGFILTTWVAGKIYRTGILMYGKKPTWKEMWKWAFRRA